jgi:hypothetical protein
METKRMLRLQVQRRDEKIAERDRTIRSLESAVLDRDARISGHKESLEAREREIGLLKVRLSELMKDVPFKVGQYVKYAGQLVRVVSQKGEIVTLAFEEYGREDKLVQVDTSLLSHIV